jgi:glycosyltransferase involved in cell wall biosynthesis
MELMLCGTADEGAHQAIPIATLQEWGRRPGIKWSGRVEDVVGVWREADMAVVPSLGGEGLPRAMLEAAACSRPLVVSDVPGCRHFVRNGIEGLVVPPGDAAALARALGRLAGDVCLRRKLGNAARERLIAGYTDTIVRLELRKGYDALAR